MEELTLENIRGIRQNGATDPIEYYRRPLVGALFRSRINLGLRLIPQRPFRKALEVGYGSGSLLGVLSGGVDELHGIDLDADPVEATRLLKERGHIAHLQQGSVYALPYETGVFDLIVSFSVFEHLHDYPRALAEVHRVLAPGGCFLLGMPAVSPLMTRLFQMIGHNTIDDHHVTSPAMITRAFAPAGFRIQSTGFLDFPASRPFGLRLYNNWLLTK